MAGVVVGAAGGRRARGALIINPIIYAEVSTRFERIEDLDDALPADYFRRAAAALGGGLPRRTVFRRVSTPRRQSAIADAGLLHRRARGDRRSDAAHARRDAVPHLLPQASDRRAVTSTPHRALNAGGLAEAATRNGEGHRERSSDEG